MLALRRSGSGRRHERRVGTLGLLAVAGSSVAAGAEVTVDATLTSIVGGIEVEGSVSAPWEGTCRRCLRPVGGRLEVPVRELYCPPSAPVAPSAARPPAGGRPGRPDHRDRHPAPARPPDRAGGGPGVAEAGDEETYPLGTDHLDLEPLARDALLLALPLAPLCRDDCAGLCPACGADLAVGPCGCAPVAPDPRWAALDLLRDDRGPGSDDRPR